ncbi:DUF4433 domain-containing protein [Yimella sp. NH-Cas1]|uniref:type II toxin-antitoxin system toxin DNA ADP-ribosyl transferase DarT n=1 Tax=Yimella sp. NH-Cas1 TaxID=2917726 RepID=UPI001EFB59E6|nr:DUF4433 domain-containing protein [Yimella sp. NH-Cas1]MCG8654876.1 DUF4433 domain-containing protein [Yimella sp. NH-Cas1]
MPRPSPTPILHFTRIEHLPTILESGLLADEAAKRGPLAIEIGHRGIKELRRTRAVPCGPGGFVSHYVPFYFAPRSPMMYAINGGSVPEYTEGCGRIIYVVSTVEAVLASGLDLVVSDRNAAVAFASFSANVSDFDDLVEWPLMKERMWNNTAERPDRKERRMAEALVHQRLPVECIVEIVAPTASVAAEARAMLGSLDVPVAVRPEWYF